MGKVKAVVWDMDGTLMDSIPAVVAAFTDVLQRRSRAQPASAIMAAFPLGPPRRILQELLGSCDDDDLDLYHERLAARATEVRLYAGIQTALEELTGVVRMGVLTGASRRAAGILLGATKLDRFFSAMRCGDDGIAPKPSPDGLLSLCTELGTAAAQCLFIGDTQVDLDCATAAGAWPAVAGWNPGATTAAVSPRAMPMQPTEVIELVKLGPESRAR
jgi:HAD superfamily hydrolase (TIGR01549 family)